MTIYFTSSFRNISKKDLVSSFVKNKFKFDILQEEKMPKEPVGGSDVLVAWNRCSRHEILISKFEQTGAKIILMENPYIPSPTGKVFSISVGNHNNPTNAIQCQDKGERFAALGVPIKEWKAGGEYILVCTQAKGWDRRGFGSYALSQPHGWDTMVIRNIQRYSKLPIVFRTHPKSQTEPNYELMRMKVGGGGLTYHSGKYKTMDESLSKAACVVTHTSNASVEAIIAGVPVVYTGQSIFLRDCAIQGINNIIAPVTPSNRLEKLNQLAWNQFTLEEIGSGMLFNLLGI